MCPSKGGGKYSPPPQPGGKGFGGKGFGGKGEGYGGKGKQGFSALEDGWPPAEAWPGNSGWPSAPEWPPTYGAQPPGPPPAPWLTAAAAPSFDSWSQCPAAPAAGAPPRASAILSLSSIARKLPVAPAPVPVSTRNRYAVMGVWPMQPSRPRKGRRNAASSSPLVNAYVGHPPPKFPQGLRGFLRMRRKWWTIGFIYSWSWR